MPPKLLCDESWILEKACHNDRMTVERSLENAVREVRSSDAFVVIGAGASFQAGMPLAGQLAPMVWHVVDKSPELSKALCARLGVPAANAKQAVGDDPARIKCAFECIADEPAAQTLFKECVCNLNEARCGNVSSPHEALARLIFARHVIGVLSLNWDTLLESAFQQRYGFWPSPTVFDFWKPHGDCAQPYSEWVLPHHPGVVTDTIVRKVAEYARVRPRVLLIVGYSERDETVVKRLIEPLEKQWRVYRISPSASGEGAIQVDAGEALATLAEELTPAPDTPGWQSVSFANQRGIEAAVAGERLGHRDVISCPRLPHFASALRELDALNSVEVAGPSGSGKSITVWQLAHHYNQLGWHVIRPTAPGDTTDRQRVAVVASKRWPTVVVVDDTQAQSGDFLDSLREQPDDRTKVLFGTTDALWERQSTIRVSASASVDALAKAFKVRRNEILPIVKRFDRQVGDDFLSIRIEQRIDLAAKSETPWKFAYVLRGGWQQIHHILNAAHDFDENDLLLMAVAVRQLASLDGGCTMEQLVSDARTLGHDSSWAEAAVQRLESQRVLVVSETIRCIHLRSASQIVELAFNARTPDESRKIAAMMRSVVSAPDIPLRGVSWLLSEINKSRPEIVTDNVKVGLLKRCFNAHTHVERRDASFILAHFLASKDKTAVELLAGFAGQLRTWVTEVNGEDAYAVASVINNLVNDDRQLCRKFLDEIDPRPIAEKLTSIGCEEGYVFGNLLGRLRCGCSQEWSIRFSACIPRISVLDYVGRFQAQDLEDLSEFVEGIASFDLNFGLECLETAMPVYRAEFACDALATYRKLHDLEYFVLGHPLFKRPRPSKRQRLISRSMFDGIDPPKIVAHVLACPFGDWEYYARLLGWVLRVYPAKIRQIVDAMDWDGLDSVIGDMWKTPPRELTLLLSVLRTNRDYEPIHSWVEKHAERIEKIGPILAGVSPRAVVTIVGNGNRVDLGGHNGSDWELQAWALAKIASEDKDTAKAVLRQNRSHLIRGFTELSLPEELPKFLGLVHELDSTFLTEVVATLSPEEVRGKWVESLRNHGKERRHAASQVLRKIVAVGSGPICDVANELLRSAQRRRPS